MSIFARPFLNLIIECTYDLGWINISSLFFFKLKILIASINSKSLENTNCSELNGGNE